MKIVKGIINYLKWIFVLIILITCNFIFLKVLDCDLVIKNIFIISIWLVGLIVGIVGIIKTNKMQSIDFKKSKYVLFFIPLFLALIPLFIYSFTAYNFDNLLIYVSLCVLQGLCITIYCYLFYRDSIISKVSPNMELFLIGLFYGTFFLMLFINKLNVFLIAFLVISSVINGLVGCLIMRISKNIYPLCLFNILIIFLEMVIDTNSREFVVAITIHSIIMLIYLIYLFMMNYHINNKSK